MKNVMITQPKVSIIIVTFNAAKTLDRAIQSIRNQTCKNIECLIIDGASTDSTVEIIKKYNVRYISEPDNGIYDAMNKGWRMAQGEWILYLGADDELLPNGIEVLVKECDGYDVVYGNTILKFPSGKTKKQYSNDVNRIKKSNIACHQSMIMKKVIIERLNGFDVKFKLFADYDLILRAYMNKFKFKKNSEFVSIFKIGGAGSQKMYGHIERLLIHKSNKIKINFSDIINFPYKFVKGILISIKHKFFS
jgi:glycosyltransferase